MVHSLFEDQRGADDRLFFDTRIVRVTEALLYAGRLYDRLGVAPDHHVQVRVGHGGLQDRRLVAATPGRRLSTEPRARIDESTSSVDFVLGNLDSELVSLVERLLGPLFELFDLYTLGQEVYRSLVDGFVRGNV